MLKHLNHKFKYQQKPQIHSIYFQKEKHTRALINRDSNCKSKIVSAPKVDIELQLQLSFTAYLGLAIFKESTDRVSLEDESAANNLANASKVETSEGTSKPKEL